jgi:hypothetical protein
MDDLEGKTELKYFSYRAKPTKTEPFFSELTKKAFKIVKEPVIWAFYIGVAWNFFGLIYGFDKQMKGYTPPEIEMRMMSEEHMGRDIVEKFINDAGKHLFATPGRYLSYWLDEKFIE